ncbi:hypothetical protein B296_00049228 [Ensete ventricosum]|uniref:Uncharacterized protein n=1 Tax=Ensete ventricosum TaxID=4639 RepID=A0A426X9S6_ENSVE|nr:hypothetical protein B296_00049228 [Ensete ventricosum]
MVKSMHWVDAVGNLLEVRWELRGYQEFARMRRKGVCQKKTETRRKIVRGSRKTYQEFVERIDKLAGNIPRDRQKKTGRLTATMLEAAGLAGVGGLNRPYPGIWVLSTVDPPRAGE